MAKPTKHRDKWRIRWTDHVGKRRSEVHERYADAEVALFRHRLEVAEVKCELLHDGVGRVTKRSFVLSSSAFYSPRTGCRIESSSSARSACSWP